MYKTIKELKDVSVYDYWQARKAEEPRVEDTMTPKPYANLITDLKASYEEAMVRWHAAIAAQRTSPDYHGENSPETRATYNEAMNYRAEIVKYEQLQLETIFRDYYYGGFLVYETDHGFYLTEEDTIINLVLAGCIDNYMSKAIMLIHAEWIAGFVRFSVLNDTKEILKYIEYIVKQLKED